MSLILASRSASRRAMLEAAGVRFTVRAAPVDERALEAAMPKAGGAQVATALAEAKALAIGPEPAQALVLGSDSVVEVDKRRFAKPGSREEAAAHLRLFSGRVMHLHSAVALAHGGATVWRHTAVASLQVIELSDSFIEAYLDAEWPAVSGCVGVFRIEGRGVQLFRAIEGDYFTILGMPLLAVLGALREFGELPA